MADTIMRCKALMRQIENLSSEPGRHPSKIAGLFIELANASMLGLVSASSEAATNKARAPRKDGE